jgi:hypothetical protein
MRVRASPLAASAGREHLTREDLCQGVEAVHSAIEDLTVSFRFDFVNAPANNLHARSHKTIAVKGDKTYLAHEYGATSPDGEERRYQTEAAYNGKRSTYHLAGDKRAYCVVQRMKETQTQGSGFFDLMLLNAPRPDLAATGNADQNLVSLLRCENSRLREFLEDVNGQPCHVVDLVDPRSQNVAMTVWIDTERGFLPLQQAYYGGPDHQTPLMEFAIEEAIETLPGLWFPVLGRKKIHPLAGMPLYQETFEQVLEVDGWREGKPALAVNTALPDEFFDLWKRLPLGTTLVDLDINVYWTVGGKDFAAFADSLEPVVARYDLPVPERAGVHAPAQPAGPAADTAAGDPPDPPGPAQQHPSRNSRWGLCALLLALGLLSLLVVNVRPFRATHAERP